MPLILSAPQGFFLFARHRDSTHITGVVESSCIRGCVRLSCLPPSLSLAGCAPLAPRSPFFTQLRLTRVLFCTLHAPAAVCFSRLSGLGYRFYLLLFSFSNMLASFPACLPILSHFSLLSGLRFSIFGLLPFSFSFSASRASCAPIVSCRYLFPSLPSSVLRQGLHPCFRFSFSRSSPCGSLLLRFCALLLYSLALFYWFLVSRRVLPYFCPAARFLARPPLPISPLLALLGPFSAHTLLSFSPSHTAGDSRAVPLLRSPSRWPTPPPLFLTFQLPLLGVFVSPGSHWRSRPLGLPPFCCLFHLLPFFPLVVVLPCPCA